MAINQILTPVNVQEVWLLKADWYRDPAKPAISIREGRRTPSKNLLHRIHRQRQGRPLQTVAAQDEGPWLLVQHVGATLASSRLRPQGRSKARFAHASPTLSGSEARRIKLVTGLAKARVGDVRDAARCPGATEKVARAQDRSYTDRILAEFLAERGQR